MKRRGKEKGITLMVLVVTIILLLILATVTIKLALDDKGVLSEAKEAVNEWNRVSAEEESELSKLANDMRKLRNGTSGNESSGGNTGGTEKPTNKPLTEIIGSETENIETKDINGNKIVIPAGFKVINPEEDVTKGIVIEDISANDEISIGNQYVWIPVSHVNGEKVNTIKDSSGSEYRVELARYIFSYGVVGTKVIDGSMIQNKYSNKFVEETEEEHAESNYSNRIAKNINKFKESVKNNGGYYIARYEAGDSISTGERMMNASQTYIPIFKKNQTTYNYITQPNAAMLVRNLYSNQSKNYTSDLVNSYAWDTAIIFIQEFSGDSDYSQQSKIQAKLAKTGMSIDGRNNNDIRCNIYDMAGNVDEWNTETYIHFSNNCVRRGDSYISSNSEGTTSRTSGTTSSTSDSTGFRRNYILK